MSRSQNPLNPDKTLDLGHHILKAHIYKNMAPGSTPIPPRDLQALWVAQTSQDASLALGSVRNVASPNTKVSRLLLLAGASPDAISDYLDGAPLMGVFSNQVIFYRIFAPSDFQNMLIVARTLFNFFLTFRDLLTWSISWWNLVAT